MATGADLDESLGPATGSVSDETLAGTLDGFERSHVSEPVGLARGTAVGRYVVLGRLGAGAMGVVYTAHDPELDRKVALKLLRPRGSAARMTIGRQRLLVEAQALARLSHPHVVVVHDVGEHDGQVFVAMEFVEGRTLAAWLAEARHPWPEVLDVLVQAGRGLAAAHARELVHRDFKPDNVMVGDDGRVRVMDFGLARAVDGVATDDGADGRSEPGWKGRSGSLWTKAPRELVLTDGDGMVGTPAYAAPEQLAGGRGGAAGDQFSFCVTLWEALHGGRPFVGETLPELAAKILAGELAEPPPGVSVPPWLRRIVERGLAVDPERRWPSMDALLAALDRGRVRARRRVGVVAAAGAVATAAVVVGWRYESEQRRIRACEAEGATISEAWNDQVAVELHDAMVATGVAYAEVTAQKLAPWLEAQARGWQEARTEVCLHGEVEGTWDADTLDRSLWCLDERRRQLESLVDDLRHASPQGATHAVQSAASLDRLEPCTDALSLSRQPAPPTQSREAIIAVGRELQRTKALREVGAYDEALEEARGAVEQAEALGWPPLLAATRRTVGSLQISRGAYAEAEAVLEQAFFESARAEALDDAAEAASLLVTVVGDRLARPRDGLRWAQLQELMVARLPDPTGLYQVRALEDLALMRHVMGEYTAAKELYEHALSQQEQLLGPDHIELVLTLGNLASLMQDMGDHEQAKPLNERGVALTERALGPDHPDVAVYLHNLARDLRALGEPEQAKALYQRALTIWEASLGPDHPHVAQVLNNLGNVSLDLGAYEEALVLHERALAVRERVLGPDHPQVAQSLENLANVKLALGALEDLEELNERASIIRERALGPEHPDVASGLTSFGRALLALGRLDEARAQLERALRIWGATVAPAHEGRAHTLVGLAGVALAQGRTAAALLHADEALRIQLANKAPAVFIADSRFLLARARWAANADRAGAIALAEQARDGYREYGHAKRADEVGAWLASHR